MRVPRASERGFTLIEVMIVVAIIGVLAILGGPSLSAWIQKMRLTQAAQGIARNVENVRKFAMSTGVRHCIEFIGDAAYTGNSDYYIETRVSADDGVGGWVTVTEPPEIAGFVSNSANDRYPAVSLEAGSNTTTLAGVTGCPGLVFTPRGYLENLKSDFPDACSGATCVRLTLVQKMLPNREQRSLWIDRGGNIRISPGPTQQP